MDINKVGIVGGGTMGRGLAEHAADKGYEVVLIDRSPALLHEAKAGIELSLQKRQEKWAITEAEKRVILARIQFADMLTDVAAADLVVEMVTEDLDLKKDIFRTMDQICDRRVIFASNTSTLSITELAANTYRPDRVIGLHFLNPVPRMKLVEIVRGLKTSEETVQVAKEFVGSLDKTGVEVYESPGFVSTRLIIPLINEAMYALMEGVATAEGVDTTMKLGYDMARGPLEMADRIGLDTLLTAMERLFRDYGDLKYRPCPLLRKLVRGGHLGVKTGQGFFKYDKEGDLVRP